MSSFRTNSKFITSTEEDVWFRISHPVLGSKWESLKKKIYWIRRTESQMTLSHGGRTLLDGSTFGDRHSNFSDVQYAVDDAFKAMKDFSINEMSTILSQVTTTVYDFPYVDLTDSHDIVENEKLREAKSETRIFEEIPNGMSKRVENSDFPKLSKLQYLYPAYTPIEIDKIVVWTHTKQDNVSDIVSRLKSQYFNFKL